MGPLVILGVLGLGLAALGGTKKTAGGNTAPGPGGGPLPPGGVRFPGGGVSPGDFPAPGSGGGVPLEVVLSSAQRFLALPAPMTAAQLDEVDQLAATCDAYGRPDVAGQLRARATADRALLQGSSLLAQVTQLLNLPPQELPPVPGPITPGAPVAPPTAPEPQRTSAPSTVEIPGLGKVQLPTEISVPGLGTVKVPSGGAVEVPPGPLGPTAPVVKPIPEATKPLDLDSVLPENAIDPRLKREQPTTNDRELPSQLRPDGIGWFPPGTPADDVRRYRNDPNHDESPWIYIKDTGNSYFSWGEYWKSLPTEILARTVIKNVQLGSTGYDRTLLTVWQSRNRLKADGLYGKQTRETLKAYLPRDKWPTLPLQWV